MSELQDISLLLDRHKWIDALNKLSINDRIIDNDNLLVMKLFALSRINKDSVEKDFLSKINKFKLTKKNRIRYNDLLYIYIMIIT